LFCELDLRISCMSAFLLRMTSSTMWRSSHSLRTGLAGQRQTESYSTSWTGRPARRGRQSDRATERHWVAILSWPLVPSREDLCVSLSVLFCRRCFVVGAFFHFPSCTLLFGSDLESIGLLGKKEPQIDRATESKRDNATARKSFG